ncbi:unnamed protein product [Chrysoparadoxa australica]
MRLLTHNSLRSTINGVEEGYPLNIETARVETTESDVSEEFLRHIAPTLDWNALRQATTQVGMPAGALPAQLTAEMLNDSAFLAALHKILLDIHVVEGALVCPESNRRFPITDGIPNMMISEEEASRDDR